MDKNVVYLKAMTALTGKLVACFDNEEAKAIVQAMKEMQDFEYDSDEVIKKALKYCPDGTIKYLIVNKSISKRSIFGILDFIKMEFN